jgi:uncharacterized protein
MEFLSADVLEALVDRLVERFRPRRVVLFGSHAYGEPREWSDIDIVVVVEKPPRFPESFSLAREIAPELPLQLVFMDPVEWEETRDVVGGIAYPAHHEGRVLYAA